MKTGKSGLSEDRKKTLAIVVFALILIGVLYFQLSDVFFPPTKAPVATAPTTLPAAGLEKPSAAVGSEKESSAEVSSPTAKLPTAKPLGAASAALDPALHMEAMLVTESIQYTGGGRNIFSTNSVPIAVIQKPVAAARPVAAPPVVPCPPNCPPPPPPPPPPVIDLVFFGTYTLPNGTRHAFIKHEDSVLMAAAGDIVLRRYRIVSIEAKFIRVEDMQYKNTQTLPLITN